MPGTLIVSGGDGARGRLRAATYPPHARGSDESGHECDMMESGRSSMDGARLGRIHTSPSCSPQYKRSLSLTRAGNPNKMTLRSLHEVRNNIGPCQQHHHASRYFDELQRGGPVSSRRNADDADGGGSSGTGSFCSSRQIAREGRRRGNSRRSSITGGAWEDVASPANKQQRIVLVMFRLVMVLGSVQIITLIFHPPPKTKTLATRERLLAGGSATGESVAVTPRGENNGRVATESNGESGTFRNPMLRGGITIRRDDTVHLRENSINTRLEPGFVARGAGEDGREQGKGDGRPQRDAFSLTDPRAFEMMAADMGNLKDKVEKLDQAFRDTMSQQKRDLAAIMDQLGLQTVGSLPVDASQAAEADTPPLRMNVPEFFFSQQSPESQENSAHGAGPVGGLGSAAKAWVGDTSSTAKGNLDKTSSSDATSRGGRDTVDSRGKEGRTDVVAGEETGSPKANANGSGNTDGGKKVQNRGRNDTSLDTVWNAYSQGSWINGQWVPKVLLDETVPDLTVLSDQNHSRRVLLLSERRSGGQVVGGVLNADPRVFYVGDPCRMGGGPEALDGPNCVAVVSRLLACQPTINDIRNLFSFSYLLEHSRPLSEFEKLRWQAGGIPDYNDEVVRDMLSRDCRQSKVVVIKETRLPELATQLLAPALATEFLHVVRDPRAAVHGLAQTWKGSQNKIDQENDKDCTDLATKLCALTENKLGRLTELGRDRFRVLKYEMVLNDPVAMMQSIYNWLDLGRMPKEVNGAIMHVAAPGATQDPQPLDYSAWTKISVTAEAFERATRWTTEMPVFRRQQVQDACESLLVALGYDAAFPADQPSSVVSVSSTSIVTSYGAEEEVEEETESWHASASKPPEAPPQQHSSAKAGQSEIGVVGEPRHAEKGQKKENNDVDKESEARVEGKKGSEPVAAVQAAAVSRDGLAVPA